MRDLFRSSLVACMLVFAFTNSIAQVNIPIKPLKIGDTVPDIIIKKMIRPDVSGGKLSDYKSELLILDFWDTYCGSCIELMPKMDSLQDKFGGKIKILPVTYQKDSLIKQFFNTNKFVKNVKLSCVVEDKVLTNYFPHKSISHLVWIFKGVVKAVTYSEYLSSENIQMILNGESVNWPVKTDVIKFDYNLPFETTRIGTPILKEYQPGVERKTDTVYDSASKYTRLYYVNFSVLDMFRNAWSKIQPHNFIPHPGRLVMEVKNPSKYIYDAKKDYADQWSAKNVFCYERTFKKVLLSKEDYRQIIKDLDDLFKVHCHYEERMADCLIIYPLKGKVTSYPISTLEAKNQKIDEVAFWLDYTYKYPPVIDESQYKLPIAIGEWKGDLELLKKELNKSGFDIKKGRRKILQMVLTESR